MHHEIKEMVAISSRYRPIYAFFQKVGYIFHLTFNNYSKQQNNQN